MVDTMTLTQVTVTTLSQPKQRHTKLHLTQVYNLKCLIIGSLVWTIFFMGIHQTVGEIFVSEMVDIKIIVCCSQESSQRPLTAATW